MFFLCLLITFVISEKSLIGWVEENGGFVHRERLSVKRSAFGGYGLFLEPCHTNCEPDPLLLSIPYKLFFHPFSPYLSPETQSRVKKLEHTFQSSEVETKFEHLLHYALALELQNTSSFFQPYFSSITLTSSFGIALEGEETELLRDLGDRHGIVERIVKFYSLAEWYRNEFNRILDQPLVSNEQFLQAYTITGSRSFSQYGWLLGPLVPPPYRERSLIALIPLMDLVNHGQMDPSENRYTYYPARTEGANYSLRWWPTSEELGELFIAYHPPFKTPLISFVHYGFVVRQNFSKTRKELLEFLDVGEGDLVNYLEGVESALGKTKNLVMKQYLKETERVLLFLLGEIGKKDL